MNIYHILKVVVKFNFQTYPWGNSLHTLSNDFVIRCVVLLNLELIHHKHPQIILEFYFSEFFLKR